MAAHFAGRSCGTGAYPGDTDRQADKGLGDLSLPAKTPGTPQYAHSQPRRVIEG